MEEDINKLASTFKVLGNPARIKILQLIAQNNKLMVQEIVQEMNMAQSTISEHLSALKNANLIKSESEATKTIYSIKTKNIDKVEKSIRKLLKQIAV
jgi:DNA-binding transcriptional ArsR family regulator